MVRGPMVKDGSGTEAMNTCALAGAGTTTRRRRARKREAMRQGHRQMITDL
jgi:hypothetical protein